MKMLVGHTTPQTAYVQDDYPYGLHLRCRRRLWIETKPSRGQRLVTQTLAPDTQRPNNPHRETFATLTVAFLVEESDVGVKYPYGYGEIEIDPDDVGKVLVTYAHRGMKLPMVEKFVELFGAALLDDYALEAILKLRKEGR